MGMTKEELIRASLGAAEHRSGRRIKPRLCGRRRTDGFSCPQGEAEGRIISAGKSRCRAAGPSRGRSGGRNRPSRRGTGRQHPRRRRDSAIAAARYLKPCVHLENLESGTRAASRPQTHPCASFHPTPPPVDVSCPYRPCSACRGASFSPQGLFRRRNNKVRTQPIVDRDPRRLPSRVALTYSSCPRTRASRPLKCLDRSLKLAGPRSRPPDRVGGRLRGNDGGGINPCFPSGLLKKSFQQPAGAGAGA